MRRLLWLITAGSILAASACTQLGPLIGISSNATVSTGAVKGKVVDRNRDPLNGARVTNGAAVCMTGGTILDDRGAEVKLGDGEFVLAKLASGSIATITAEYDGKVSTPLTVRVKGEVYNSQTSLTTLDDSIVIPVDGPVTESALKAVQLLGITIGGHSVSTITASGSTSLSYMPSDTVTMTLQAPPGSTGNTIKSYKLSYYPSSADPTSATPLSIDVIGVSNSLKHLTTSVAVLPGGTSTRSGPATTVQIPVTSADASFSAYVKKWGELQAKIELFDNAQTQARVTDRSGSAVSTVVNIQYKP